MASLASNSSMTAPNLLLLAQSRHTTRVLTHSIGTSS